MRRRARQDGSPRSAGSDSAAVGPLLPLPRDRVLEPFLTTERMATNRRADPKVWRSRERSRA
eukprot:9413723-Lingulodinium_polyedra.AAC.1